ncbi:MAG: NTP transferase domain-containing protein, partial [Planctomycetota bacterium]
MEEKHKGITQQTIVVILAAGKGTRMGKGNLAKVCLKIDSVPAINRSITTFRKLRFNRFMVVVGDRAEQVIETISKEHPDII